MRNFDAWMRDHQVSWRQRHITEKRYGYQNGVCYPWILPKEKWEEGLWPGIRTGSQCSVRSYLDSFGVHEHPGVHNLKSSWVSGVNLYFPFRETEDGRKLLAGFLRQSVSSSIDRVDSVELEYAEDGDGPLHPSVLLGELDGSRGSGQTSPDLAFVVNGARGLILTENKLTEHSFYPCSARRRSGTQDRPGNPDPGRCKHISAVLASHGSVCHQCTWGRKYWDVLMPIVSRHAMSALSQCPAAHGGYQLFRQQALAEGIASSRKYDFVVSCVALDGRNDALLGCLKTTGIHDIAAEWPKLFVGNAGFAVFSHQSWVSWVRQHDMQGLWHDWLAYVGERYGYT